MKFGAFDLASGVSALAIGVFLSSATAAHAQEVIADENSVALAADVIVVTAQKRQSTLFDTAAPISALSGDSAEDRGVASINDLVNQLPGFAVNADFGGGANTKISIRGVGGTDETRPNGSASVAFHMDNVFQANSLFLTSPLYDIERIEVLKGPQGTLYGRNATAGVVNLITRDAGDDLNGYLRFEAATFGRYYVEGAIGGEIADGLGVRLAGVYETGGGFIDGLGAGGFTGLTTAPGVVPPIEDPGMREGFADKDVLSIRGTVNWDLGDMGALRLKGAITRDRGEPQYLDTTADSVIVDGAPAVDVDPYTFTTGEYSQNTIDLYAVSADYNVALGENLNLDLIAGYQTGDRELFGNGLGSALRIFNFDFVDSFEQVTVEGRISDNAGGFFDWMIGGYFLSDSVDFFTEFAAEELPFITASLAPTRFNSDYSQERTSKAVFAQVDVPITEQLILSGGLRGTFDDSEYAGVTTDLNTYGLSQHLFFFDINTGGFTEGLEFVPQANGPTISRLAFETEQTDDNLSGRVTVQYYPADDFNVYVSYGTGYKAGGFDGSTIVSLAEAEPFDAETVTAYEVGAKWFPASGRFNVTLDGFYYDFQELQGTALGPQGANLRFNIAEAELYGAELALNANLFTAGQHTFDVYFGASFIQSEITDLDERAISGIEVGATLPAAPDFTANWAATYSYELNNGWALKTIVDGRHTSEEYKRLTNEGPSLIDPYTLLNTRLELEMDNGVELFVFARNVTDKAYFLDASGSSRLVAAPRTIGGGFRLTF